MDEKNAIALATSGIENLLTQFANLPDTPGNTGPAKEFEERNGVLFPELTPEYYCAHVRQFRRVWTAKSDAAKLDAEVYIEHIFDRSGPLWEAYLRQKRRFPRPALGIDFSAGRIRVKPETLLDAFALALLTYKDKLGFCQRDGCSHPYILKSHARQRFCAGCAKVVRARKKEEWWAKNRVRFLTKWRKQRKAASRKKSSTRKEK